MVRYDPAWVRTYYNEYGEKEWERWEKSPVEQVKFEVHVFYLRKYLQANDRILEIGAGAGRFTQELARISNRIVVADISPVQLQLNRENAHRLGFSESIEDWVESDACHLPPHLREEEFDAVVCYGGPLSYVLDERDKAMQELLYVTKPGGLLFVGVMSLWGSVHHSLSGVLTVDPELNAEIIATGELNPDEVAGARHFCHMYRADEFRRFLERAGVIIETLSASDCLSANWAEYLRTIQKDTPTWRHLMEMEIEACQEPGCLDMGTHLIAVCRKTVSQSPRPDRS